MGVARCNKSTGDMREACREHKLGAGPARSQKRPAAANAASKFEQLKQTSISYLMLGPAGRHFSKSNKSLASSEEEDEEEADEPAPAGRRKPLLAERFGIELDDSHDDSRDVTQQPEGDTFAQRKNARSSCYIWLAEPDEQADEQLELERKMNCHPSERHIRLALSSPMLHESSSEQFGSRPAGVSCRSLAKAPAAPAGKSGGRRKLRHRHKLASSQETRTRRRLRSRPIVCDSDSDTCEPGAERLRAARGRGKKAQHHARSAADLPLMLHNCETIDAAGQRWPANNSAAVSSELQAGASAALAAGERQFATGGLGELAPQLQQTNAQPGQRRGRPTSSAPAENNAGRRRERSSHAAADKLAAAGELAGGQLGQPAASPTSAGEQGRELGARPERHRPSSRPDQERSCAPERDGVEAKCKLTSASERDPQPEQPESGPPHPGSLAMGVDVNDVVSRLVDTCAQSWRRSQSGLLAGNSRCYKVAQSGAHLALQCGAPDSGRLCEPREQRQEQEAARADSDGGKQAATSRLARSGRSPVSLQRQTNARLARHRLKIQHQRQEQLANLALRERQQFRYRDFSNHIAPNRFCSTTSFQSSSQPQDHTEIEILESEPSGQQRRRSSLDYFRHLIGRLPASLNPSRRQSRELAPASPEQEATASARLPPTDLDEPPPRGRARSFGLHRPTGGTSQAPVASSSSSSCHFALTIEPSRLQRAINANISSAPSRSGRPRDLAQALAQANVIVHRSPNDLLRDGRRAAVGAATRDQQQHQEARRSPARGQASRGQQQSRAQPHQFRFQYHHMASEQQGGRSAAGRGQKADDTLSNSGDSSASSTLSLNKPFCKICHLSSSRHGDKLISPCKCAGTMQFVHCGCLLKWLEISNRTHEKQPMSCELCAHEYTWHKRFNLKQMKLPKCSLRDVFLHSIFVLALGVMMFCALAPMFSTTRNVGAQPLMTAGSKMQLSSQNFAQSVADEAKVYRGSLTFGDDALASIGSSPGRRPPFKSASSGPHGGSRLANDEKFILFCAAAFFVSFFVAIYAQTKARDTLYGLIVKFANMNLTYYITEYDHGQQHQHQQQQQSTSNKSADFCNSMCSPTDSNHGDLNHCQPPAPGGIREASLLGQTGGRHRADFFESPDSARHFKRT